MYKVLAPAIVLLLCINTGSAASPVGADVVLACEESLANDFEGMKGMMCTWYVTPCDCTTGKDPEIQRVCLPDDLEVEELARQVIEGLKLEPELQSKSAEVASSIILSKKYPCD